MPRDDFERLAHVHAHRLARGREVLTKAARGMESLQQDLDRTKAAQDSIDDLLAEANALLDNLPPGAPNLNETLDGDIGRLERGLDADAPAPRPGVEFEKMEILEETDDPVELFRTHMDYARRHGVDVEARLTTLLTAEELADLSRRLDEEFTFRHPNCDAWDYMIAGTAGLLGGLMDVFLVGSPGEGVLGAWADKQVDGAVRGFARLCGWSPSENSDPTKSAIGFLERTFRVNYDQRYGPDVNNLFKMGAKNHHIKSLGHSPDLAGLFFSILGQFTDQAFFVDKGRLISVSAEGTLQGGNAAAKLFSGVVNWLGHLFSDVAGSSGAQGRGSGIPIPFFGLLQFANVGSFGQYRQTFATVCVQVFEQGYDLRHSMAMSIPVLVTELVIRVVRMIKLFLAEGEGFDVRRALAMTPELQRMLFVGHGVFCLVDLGDAALRSWGTWPAFFARLNLVEWVRFGTLACKELVTLVKAGHIDAEKLDRSMEKEYRRILADLEGRA